ncbi:MAG: NADH-quinone oxidoreductase subunit N, partial [Bacteroidetes bacterium]|nr:NADH-quinone oxidoreductase subunit N [Bacteroidota bacterium]
MLNNIQEFYNILPLVIIGGFILISVVIEIYWDNSEKFLPWFSIIGFLSAGIYALIDVGNTSIVFQNMLATGGVVNIFWLIFNVNAAIV